MSSPVTKRASWTEPGRRLDERRRELDDLSVSALARIAGITYETANNALQGRREPRGSTLYALCAALRLNHYWVLTGQGTREATDAEVVRYRAKAGSTSQAELLPVAPSSGVWQWLTETDEGRRTTAPERAWLEKFPWPDPAVRYPNLVYATMLSLYREMTSKPDAPRE